MNFRSNIALGRIIGVIYALSGFLMLFLTAMLIGQIFVRSIGLEIDGMGELAQFAAIWMALLIIGNLEYEERHIRVGYFVDKLPERYQHYVDVFVLFVNTVTMGFLLLSALFAVYAFRHGQSTALQIPSPLYHAAPLVGFFLLFFLYGTDLLSRLQDIVFNS